MIAIINASIANEKNQYTSYALKTILAATAGTGTK